MRLRVDPEDAHFLNKKWAVSGKYAFRTEKGKTVYLHRLIAEKVFGACPENNVVDHVNRKTFDNRRSNLRYVTPVENSRNTRMHFDNSSGFKGVSWNSQKQKWRSTIMVKGEWKHLGNFKDKASAVSARKSAEKNLWE